MSSYPKPTTVAEALASPYKDQVYDEQSLRVLTLESASSEVCRVIHAAVERAAFSLGADSGHRQPNQESRAIATRAFGSHSWDSAIPVLFPREWAELVVALDRIFSGTIPLAQTALDQWAAGQANAATPVACPESEPSADSLEPAHA